MGRKKIFLCKINFDDQKTLRQKLESMFNTYNLISCFSEEHIEPYKEVFEHPDVVLFFKDTELLETIDRFFENNLNITLTAQKMFLHRNTLIYRLEKIKKILDLDIRNFEEAIIVKNLMYIQGILE